MSKKEKCHLCGFAGGHTKQCSMNIKVDPKAVAERQEREKQKKEKIAKLPK
jgi:hypothetical protein